MPTLRELIKWNSGTCAGCNKELLSTTETLCAECLNEFAYGFCNDCGNYKTIAELKALSFVCDNDECKSHIRKPVGMRQWQFEKAHSA